MFPLFNIAFLVGCAVARQLVLGGDFFVMDNRGTVSSLMNLVRKDKQSLFVCCLVVCSPRQTAQQFDGDQNTYAFDNSATNSAGIISLELDLL